MKHSGVSFLDNTLKNFKSNLALVVVLPLESKGLQCQWRKQVITRRSFIILRSGEGLTPSNKK